MNKFLIGFADKTEQLLQFAKGEFLLIDDGEICDAFLARFDRAAVFDPTRHSFNPLKAIDYQHARAFAELLYGISPQGQNTLTVRNGKRELTKLFLSGAAHLNDYPTPKETKDPFEKEALGMIEDLLLSPMLRSVLCGKEHFRFQGRRKIIAHINRAELGDFDAIVLANLLIGQFQGHIIVPDFGFYGRDFHTSLVRQNRLTAGLNSLSEIPAALQQSLLGIRDKTVYRTTLEDAERLLPYFPITKPSQITDLEGQKFLIS